MSKGRTPLLAMLFILLGAGCTVLDEPTPTPKTPTAIPPSLTPTQLPPPPTLLPPTATSTPTPAPMETLDPSIFELRSPAFGMQEDIPRLYTCNDKDISPALIWGNPPESTQSFVLLMDDITVGNFVHWVYFNIPAEIRSLPEAVPPKAHFDDGSQQGINQRFELGYSGPCPMPGPNQYRLRLFALDTVLGLEDGVMMIPLKAAMEGHILAETELIGVYP